MAYVLPQITKYFRLNESEDMTLSKFVECQVSSTEGKTYRTKYVLSYKKKNSQINYYIFNRNKLEKGQKIKPK